MNPLPANTLSSDPNAVRVQEFSITGPESDLVKLRKVPLYQAIYNNATVRRVVIIAALMVIWQTYALWLNNPFLFPRLDATLEALYSESRNGILLTRSLISLKVLLTGYFLGILFAAVLTLIATSSKIGLSFLETLAAMLSPLPSIALLPLAMLWLGLGNPSLVFVLIHAVAWVVAMNTFSGFQSVSPTLRMVGHNYGLGWLAYVRKIFIPAALPNILAGLKIGWAFAWRTLIAAELIFGASSGQGGLGWYIFQNKNSLEVANVFAGLLAVILIGLFVDIFIFKRIERMTVLRWGMQS
jgi:NitT/TauT family transport system permease protein